MDGLSDAVLYAQADGVAYLTLNRAEAMNAINDPLRNGVRLGIARAEADPEIRVIVLAAAGSRAFCVGADVKEARGPETAIEARARLASNDWILAVAQAKKPVIAAVQGHCLGAGLELALAADIRIASQDAKFGLPETALGLIPGGGGTQRLPRVIGQARALDMMLSGEPMGAEEALRLGLITRMVAQAEELPAAAQTLARRIAARPPLATRFVKEAVFGGEALPLSEGLALERNLFALLLTTEDRREAAAAFREKRTAVFQGR